MKIYRKSPLTGEENAMDLDITAEEVKMYESGELVQRAFPRLTADEREFIISGLMPGEFDQIFNQD